ncbi:hypothetical protein D3C78_861900 [compost metagenome]
MHQGHRAAIVVHGILQRLAHETLGAFQGNRLDADAAVLGEADLLDAHFLGEELDDLLRLRGTGFPLHAGVDVFGVLTEDHHVHITRLLHRARHAFEPAHRALTDVQVELLAQGNVQRADATTDRSSQRPLDGNDVVTHRLEGFVRQPGVLIVDLCGLLASIDFHPCDLASALVGFLDCGIDDLDHHRRDIHADAITLDVRDDRIIRHIQGHVGIDADLFADRRHLDLLVSHAELRFLWLKPVAAVQGSPLSPARTNLP